LGRHFYWTKGHWPADLQPTKVQRHVEPSNGGVVQSSRFVKSAAHGITDGTSVKNDARIKGEQVVDD
jgi:hypothetical protein